MQPRSYFVSIFIIVLCTTCDNEPDSTGLTSNVIDQTFGVELVDTTTVAVSTVLLDSIPTSGTGTLLVGGYQDDMLGRLRSEGYLQIGNGDTWQPPATASLDSLVLVARYSGYYYGDTTNAQTFEVRRVLQTFKTYNLSQYWVDEGQHSALYTASSLYNSSSFQAEVPALGSKTVRLRPGSQDSLTVRLDDTLGKEWLQFAKDKNNNITEQSRFLEYFKGVAISNTSSDPAVVMGFTTADVKLRLYYKQYVSEQLKQQVHEFPFVSTFYNYNKISSDRAGTVTEKLTEKEEEIATAETEDIAFIQAGTGVVTKVSFPYISKLIDLDKVLIVNQAQLIIEPVKNTFDKDYPLPNSLTLYQTDKRNLPISQLYADYSTETAQTAYIRIDKEFDTSTGYIFTITQFIQGMLSTEGNQERGLLIMPPSTEINKTVNKVYLGAGRGAAYRVRLKVWFTRKK